MKYVFLYVGSDEVWERMPKEEGERIYQDIFRWFEVNRDKFGNGGLWTPRS